MTTTIEEEVLKTLLEGGWTDGDNVEPIDNITILFFEFIKWKDKNVGNPNKNGKYLYWEQHFTLEDLCNYWIIYIYKA
jgi:hypothetical protein